MPMTSAFKKVAVFVKPTEIMVVPLQALIKVIEACGAEGFFSSRPKVPTITALPFRLGKRAGNDA